MKLLIRFFWLILTSNWRSPCEPRGPVKTPLLVFPNDLDLNGHVNNGVYLTYADLGRFDMLLRAGVFGKILKQGWYPVVVSQTVRFYKSLKLFQRFTIETRVIGWDEKNVLMEQRYERGEDLLAVVIVNSRFLSRKGGSVSTQELLEFLGVDGVSSPLPDWIADWYQSAHKE